MSSATTQPDVLEATEALAEAAAMAGRAPSIHNTQPWHWRVRPGSMDLWRVPTRQLMITDPDARMCTISCGAALHHARISLAAQGYQVTVLTLPDPSHPDHLAHLTLPGRRPVTPAAMRLYQAVGLRRTDRRPVTATAVSDAALLAIAMAVQAEEQYLHVLRPEQVIELASAASYAQRNEVADEAWRAELAYWAGGSRPDGTGVPDASIPTDLPQTTVPERDFGRPGSLPVSAGHDTTATYALLYGERDDALGWLCAGQALSAGWLAATELGVAVMPLSAAVEIPATRQRLRRMLTDGCHPQLVLRLGIADPDHRGPAPTPRLSITQTVETIDD